MTDDPTLGLTFSGGGAYGAALAFRYGGRFYNYQGLRHYKDKFQPQWTGAYLAYPRGVWVPSLLVDIAALVAGGYRRLLRD